MDYIVLKTYKGYIHCSIHNISYFFREDNRIIMYKKSGHKICILETLKDLERILIMSDFIRIHQNCLFSVNQEFTFVAKCRRIILQNDIELIVAKERLSFIKNKLLEKI